MTRKELLEKLVYLGVERDVEDPNYLSAEESHRMADALLLKFIDDSEVEEAFNNIECYYT